MPGFVPADNENFLPQYVRIARHSSPEEAGAWLLANASNMQEDMFFNRANEWAWEVLSPEQVMALRAVTPAGVFTPTAKGGYISLMGDTPEVAGMAEMLFADDYTFARSLTPSVKAQIVTLMNLAYRRGIRPADRYVREM